MAKLPVASPAGRDAPTGETSEAPPRAAPPDRSYLKPAAILTALAVAAGLGLGVHLVRYVQVSESDNRMPELVQGEGPAKSRLYQLKPIVTNIADPASVWLRLEASVVFADDMPNSQVIIAEVSEDILSFLKTLKIGQIEGSSQLQHLREDLKDRVAVRTGGDVSDIIIESLVVQ